MAETLPPYAEDFPVKSGSRASYYNQSPSRRDIVDSVLVTAAANHMEPVSIALESGIPSLTAATGLIVLISEGVLTKGTLEVNYTDSASNIEAPQETPTSSVA